MINNLLASLGALALFLGFLASLRSGDHFYGGKREKNRWTAIGWFAGAVGLAWFGVELLFLTIGGGISPWRH